MNPQQLRHTYKQCAAETDRRAQEAHRTEHQLRQLARQLPAGEGAGSIFQGSGCLYGRPVSAQRGSGRGGPGPGPLVESTGGGSPGARKVTEPVLGLPQENLGRQAQRNSMWAQACPDLILWAVTRNRKATETLPASNLGFSACLTPAPPVRKDAAATWRWRCACTKPGPPPTPSTNAWAPPQGTVRLWKSRYPDFRRQMEQARHRYLTDQRQRYAEILDGWPQVAPDPARPVIP